MQYVKTTTQGDHFVLLRLRSIVEFSNLNCAGLSYSLLLVAIVNGACSLSCSIQALALPLCPVLKIIVLPVFETVVVVASCAVTVKS